MTRVHIEFQRVQTWLFKVPRLRAMLGANTLLGEMLRIKLPELAKTSTDSWALASGLTGYPPADPDDPLKEHDAPKSDAQGGILSRDGGHFEALFEYGADAFADEASRLIRRELKGLRFKISLDGNARDKVNRHLSTELPVLAPCEWTGRGLASATVQQGHDERPSVSMDVKSRHEAAKRSENQDAQTAQDLASLLSQKTSLKTLERAQELKDLVGSGYLALIHADGNGVGSALPQDASDFERAAFFHRNRVLLRRALKEAINATCSTDATLSPLIPLMLGGDDLLLVCRAETAPDFIVALCEQLETLQQHDKAPNDFKLTLGIGIVFAKYTIPIHQLHEIAEKLASSAKRRYRGAIAAGEEGQSVVDWAVYTSARVDDPGDVRRRDWICVHNHERHVLSQRPVAVLGTDLNCFQGLVKGADQLCNAPRSQLRRLIDELPRGRSLSELAIGELSKEAKSVLERLGIRAPWRRSDSDGYWITELLDLVELSEISRLGSSTPGTTSMNEEVVHG